MISEFSVGYLGTIIGGFFAGLTEGNMALAMIYANALGIIIGILLTLLMNFINRDNEKSKGDTA